MKLSIGCLQSVSMYLPTLVKWNLFIYLFVYYYYYYYYFESAVQGRERVKSLYQSKTPTPHNRPMEGRKRQNSRRQKRKGRSCKQESIGSALETRQSHTIKHRVTKIVLKSRREVYKDSEILRSPTTKKRERVPMSNQIITSNMRRHMRQRQCTA